MSDISSHPGLGQKIQEASRSGGINLGRVNLEGEGMKFFGAALQTGACFNITSLNFGDNNIGVQGMKIFGSALQAGACSKLTSLNLGHNNIGPKGMKCFAAALQEGACPKLTSLDLGFNNIGFEGMGYFAAALRKRSDGHAPLLGGATRVAADRVTITSCCNLTSLHLGVNNVGPKGMEYFVAALQVGACPNLASLNLGNNGVGPKEMQAFCAVVFKATVEDSATASNCCNLTSLNLGVNNIGPKGMEYFAAALHREAGETYPNLTSLNLGNNNPGLEGIEALSATLRGGACLNLTSLHLGSKTDPVFQDAEKILNAAIQDHHRHKQDIKGEVEEALKSNFLPSPLIGIINKYCYTPLLLLKT